MSSPKIGNDKIWETRSVELLGVTIDNDLKFDEHLLKICLKANRKLSALTRIKKYLDFHKMRVLFKAFFESQFKKLTNELTNFMKEHSD